MAHMQQERLLEKHRWWESVVHCVGVDFQAPFLFFLALLGSSCPKEEDR